MASRTERVLVASAFVIYLALALLLSRTMYSWDDETAHLAFGRDHPFARDNGAQRAHDLVAAGEKARIRRRHQH